MNVRTLARHLMPALILSALSVARLAAQAGGEQFSFADIPVDDARQYYAALGGGYLGMVTVANYDALNEKATALGLPNVTGPITMYGGGGLASVFVIPRLRIGVYSVGGSKETHAPLSTDSVTTQLRFSTVMTGAQVDYAIRLARSLNVLPGVMIGAESYTLEMSMSKNPTYDQLFSGNPGSNRYSRLSNGHAFVYLSGNAEYAITQFLLARVGVGYKTALGADTWTDQADAPVTGVPAIRANGLTVQFGLFVGLFQSL